MLYYVVRGYAVIWVYLGNAEGKRSRLWSEKEWINIWQKRTVGQTTPLQAAQPIDTCLYPSRRSTHSHAMSLSLPQWERDRVHAVHVFVTKHYYDHFMSVSFDLCCRSYEARARSRSSKLLLYFLWLNERLRLVCVSQVGMCGRSTGIDADRRDRLLNFAFNQFHSIFEISSKRTVTIFIPAVCANFFLQFCYDK